MAQKQAKWASFYVFMIHFPSCLVCAGNVNPKFTWQIAHSWLTSTNNGYSQPHGSYLFWLLWAAEIKLLKRTDHLDWVACTSSACRFSGLFQRYLSTLITESYHSFTHWQSQFNPWMIQTRRVHYARFKRRLLLICWYQILAFYFSQPAI